MKADSRKVLRRLCKVLLGLALSEDGGYGASHQKVCYEIYKAYENLELVNDGFMDSEKLLRLENFSKEVCGDISLRKKGQLFLELSDCLCEVSHNDGYFLLAALHLTKAAEIMLWLSWLDGSGVVE
jgi:hypothetical protein